jgi:hypothetical protein
VQIRFALWTRAIKADIRRNGSSARGAFYFLTKGHHAWRTWFFAIPRLRLLFWARLTFPIAFHVTALSVFSVAHVFSPENYSVHHR